MKIGKYEFVNTSMLSESYDVFDESNNKIAYVIFDCEKKMCVKCPDYIGEVIYTVNVNEYSNRLKYLNWAVNAIYDYYHRIRTVGDLIEVLQQLPKDAKISYDYGLPVHIEEFEDGYTIG